MKILNVIGSVDARNGGTTDHVFTSSRVWSRQGHVCHILCLDPPDADCVARSPLITFAVGPRNRFNVAWRRLLPFLRYGYTPKLRIWLKKNAKNYDAIVLNGLWNYTSYGTWFALRDTGVPYYVCPHGMLDPWLREVHPARHFARKIFWWLFEWKVLRDARGVFFASEEERRLASQSYLRDSSHCYVMGYGTNDATGDARLQTAAFHSKFPRARDRKLILFLGRIHPKKGLDLLIKSFARVATEFAAFDLVIAGPDDAGLTPKLVDIAADLGIEKRIHWTGMLTGDEKWGAFRTAEIFVLPSHQENFGIAVVEAMAAALPVLITKKVNIWREIQSCGAGYAVMDDVDGVADGLRFMCGQPQSDLETMSINARKCFLELFNIENNATELADLIKRLGEMSR